MLINCAAYQDGEKLGDIAPEDISKYVSRPECFVWVAMKDPGPGELAAMQHEFDLHELAVEDARHGHQRPKIEEYGDSLFAVLHNIEFVSGERPQSSAPATSAMSPPGGGRSRSPSASVAHDHSPAGERCRISARRQPRPELRTCRLHVMN